MLTNFKKRILYAKKHVRKSIRKPAFCFQNWGKVAKFMCVQELVGFFRSFVL